MFDFAFSELVVICVVALVVLGPTRLPGVVRKVGRWIGKARSMARDFRQQLENEVTLDELNRMTERQTRAASATPEPDVPPAAGIAETGTPEAGTEPGTVATQDPMAAAGYPYGMPTDTSAMSSPSMSSSSMATSADPATVMDPSDDTFSHAHAADEPPPPWSPEADGPPAEEPVTPGNGTEAESADTRRA